MLLGAVVAVASLDCGSSGSGGTGGIGGGPCFPYMGGPQMSTIEGTGFEGWEGEPVQGQFFPTQAIFPPNDATSTVVSGRFSLTASACSGYDWRVTVGAAGHQIDCDGVGAGPTTTPDACWCQTGSGWAFGGSSGHDCAAFDGGRADAPASD